MAKKQDVTVVSDLVARANFTVSARGKMVDGKLVGAVPSTNFSIEVTYANQREMLEYATPTSVICLQQFLRDEYLANGKFSFAAGTRIKVGANGRYARPAPMPTKERLLSATWAEKIHVAETYGLEVPQAWRDALKAESALVEDATGTEDGEDESGYKYDEEVLTKLNVAKLKVLAQNEQLEGYDEMTKDEIVEELAMIEK